MPINSLSLVSNNHKVHATKVNKSTPVAHVYDLRDDNQNTLCVDVLEAPLALFTFNSFWV